STSTPALSPTHSTRLSPHPSDPPTSHHLLSSTSLLFFSMTPPPPRSTLFPYTTLFRSHPGSRSRPRARRDKDRILRSSLSAARRSEEHTSELQSRVDLVCRLLLEKKKRRKKSGYRSITGQRYPVLTACARRYSGGTGLS